MIIQGKKDKWSLNIGLEVHAQLMSKSKLFSSSQNTHGQESNEHVSFIDAAMPGMLPVMNKECVSLAVKASIALNASVNKISIFDRKNYFYPDSPQGYQISQFFYPIACNGNIKINTKNGAQKAVIINRIHIEQDAGKSTHDQSPSDTFIDLNRAGTPLIEIVTNPDFTDGYEVEQFMKQLRNTLRYANVCDGDLEKGSMRCDANISVKKVQEKNLGTRVEVKNLNSFKNISKAIAFEANRQVVLLESQGSIICETRLFNASSGITKSMRKKEDNIDYRYFPDPDLLPLKISTQYINNIKNTLPELPEEKKKRYIREYGITNYDAEILTANRKTAEFFEVIAKKVDPKLATNWICAELFGRLNKLGLHFNELSISTKNFCSLLELIISKKISGKIAKEVLDKMFQTNDSPEQIVQKYNLLQISNASEIEGHISNVLTHYSDKVEEYRAGRVKLFAFFVGKVMQYSKGKANPQTVNALLSKKLSSKQKKNDYSM